MEFSDFGFLVFVISVILYLINDTDLPGGGHRSRIPVPVRS
jgi:hypothetical protein